MWKTVLLYLIFHKKWLPKKASITFLSKPMKSRLMLIVLKFSEIFDLCVANGTFMVNLFLFFFWGRGGGQNYSFFSHKKQSVRLRLINFKFSGIFKLICFKFIEKKVTQIIFIFAWLRVSFVVKRVTVTRINNDNETETTQKTLLIKLANALSKPVLFIVFVISRLAVFLICF